MERFWRFVWGLTRSQYASEMISEVRMKKRIARMFKEARSITLHQ